MIIRDENAVTEAVLAELGKAPDSRVSEILSAFVRHLHDFAREVKLTEDEFRRALQYIVSIGQQTTDSHNEAVLMAGSLGLSTLVCLLNNGGGGLSATMANLLGPFWRMSSPATENGSSIVRSATPGPALFVNARVTGSQGTPVAGASVDVWHSSPAGLYDIQDPQQADMNLRGRFTTDAEGRFWFRTVKPAGFFFNDTAAT